MQVQELKERYATKKEEVEADLREYGERQRYLTWKTGVLEADAQARLAADRDALRQRKFALPRPTYVAAIGPAARGRAHARAERQVGQLLAEHSVVLFGESTDAAARWAKQLLRSKGVAFRVFDVDSVAHPGVLRQALRRQAADAPDASGLGLYIRGKRVGEGEDFRAAAANGELKSRLDAAGVTNTF